MDPTFSYQQTPPTPPVPSPILPPQPAPTHPMIMVVVAFLIFSAGLAGGYLLRGIKTPPEQLQKPISTTPIPPTPTPDPAASWLSYTDAKTYTIKYPPTMTIIPPDPANNNWFSITNKPNATTGLDADPTNKAYYQIEIVVQPAQGATLQTIASNFDRFKTRTDYTRTDYMLDGTPGYKVTNISLDSITDGVEVVKNGQTYWIGYRRLDKAVDKDGQAVFEKILSTFKYIN